MKRRYKRWYEKNEYLSVFMDLFEDLDEDCQIGIALDIILEASKIVDREYDKIIKDVANYNPKKFKRWYDKTPNLHLAIEILRDLDENQLEEVIQKISDRIIDSHYIKVDFDKNIETIEENV